MDSTPLEILGKLSSNFYGVTKHEWLFVNEEEKRNFGFVIIYYSLYCYQHI